MPTVRIISGSLRGRRITVPSVAVLGFRPATDRAKEAMFSTLETMVPLSGARVIDLYAGTGSLGMEAISRGAAFCDFVEQEGKLCDNLRLHLEKFGIAAQAAVHRVEVNQLLKKGIFTANAYQLVIAGPPFRLEPLPIVEAIANSIRFEPGAVLAVVTEKGSAVPDTVPCARDRLSLVLKRDRSYGDSALRYYMVEPGPEYS